MPVVKFGSYTPKTKTEYMGSRQCQPEIAGSRNKSTGLGGLDGGRGSNPDYVSYVVVFPDGVIRRMYKLSLTDQNRRPTTVVSDGRVCRPEEV
jgi:hypothetical protein